VELYVCLFLPFVVMACRGTICPLPFSSCLLYRMIEKERSVFKEVIISVNVRKTVHMDMGTDRDVWISTSNSVRFLFVGLYGEQSVQKKCGYTRRISRSHFDCCCLHK
jgi:hypothetical protein